MLEYFRVNEKARKYFSNMNSRECVSMLGEWTENLMNLASNCRHDFSKMWFCVSSGHLVVVSLWPIFDQIGFLMQTRVHSEGAIG